MVGRFDCAVTSREITKRDWAMTPAGLAADPVVAPPMSRWRRRRPERVPWPAAPIACSGPGDTPLWSARGGTPYASPAQPDQIYRDRNSSPADRRQIPAQRNGPFLLERRVPGRKSVIAVADCGFPESPAQANSSVVIHRHRDPATAGRGKCCGTSLWTAAWPCIGARDAVPGTGARTPCQLPAVTGRARCRFHGGAEGIGGPPGNPNALKHGRYTAEAIACRRRWRRCFGPAGISSA